MYVFRYMIQNIILPHIYTYINRYIYTCVPAWAFLYNIKMSSARQDTASGAQDATNKMRVLEHRCR